MKKTRLSNMLISEISLVTDPASPGANVILAKRRDTAPLLFADIVKYNENHDAQGRFATAADAVVGGVKHLAGRIHAATVHALHAVGHTVASLTPRAISPIKGGGIQIGFVARTPDGNAIHSNVQVLHTDFGQNSALRSAVNYAHKALTVLGETEVKRDKPLVIRRVSATGELLSHTPLGILSGVTASSIAVANAKAEATAAAEAEAATAAKAADEAKAKAATQQPGTIATAAGILPRPVGVKIVDNGAERAVAMPHLQEAGATPGTSDEHPYYTQNGDFVPGGDYRTQLAIERYHRNLPHIDKGGSPNRQAREYRTAKGDYIPPGLSEGNQQRLERLYANERARVAFVRQQKAAATPVERLFTHPDTGKPLREEDLASMTQSEHTAALQSGTPLAAATTRSDEMNVSAEDLARFSQSKAITVVPAVPHEDQLRFEGAKKTSIDKAFDEFLHTRDAKGEFATGSASSHPWWRPRAAPISLAS